MNALRNISDPEINELVDLVTNRIEGAAESVTERLARQRYIEGEAWLRYGTSTFVEEGHQSSWIVLLVRKPRNTIGNTGRQ